MTSSILPMYAVEAFTYSNNTEFTGNTAGVCVLDHDAQITDEIKQLIARDMNLSETAFVSKGWRACDSPLPSNEWTLRWFTPSAEVPLCGHATLASAKVLFTDYHTEGDSAAGTLRFHSKYHGVLGASNAPANGLITLNFPTQPTQPISAFPETLTQCHWLNQVIEETLRAPLIGSPKVSSFTPIDVQLSKQGGILLVRLKSRDDLLAILPNFQAMLQIPTKPLFDGIVVTAQGDGGDSPHFYSRFFAPWIGINEDPVTGVAHTLLAPYWKAVLENQAQSVPKIFSAVQLSERRGAMTCELTDNGTRVNLSGSSKITLKGEFIL